MTVIEAECTAVEVVPTQSQGVARRESFFNLSPQAMVSRATEMANALIDIVERQRLFVQQGDKKYLRVEAWITLGSFLGALPRERDVRELPDGSFEAYVDLINGDKVVSGASAICSVDEKRWGKAEKYARRSMAVTRATGKAYRIAFSWIVVLAGYEPTPSEEFIETFDKNSDAHKKRLVTYLEKKGFEVEKYLPLALERAHGRAMEEVPNVVKDVQVALEAFPA